MLRLNTEQRKMAERAYEIIIKRQTNMNQLPEPYRDVKMHSAIVDAYKKVDLSDMSDEGMMSQYDFLKLTGAIVIPNSILFFLSHEVKYTYPNKEHNEKLAEKLADFIEKNSFSISFNQADIIMPLPAKGQGIPYRVNTKDDEFLKIKKIM